MAEQAKSSSGQTATVAPPAYRPSYQPKSDYPLIDNDPHVSRVLRYARRSDYTTGVGVAALGPALMGYWEWKQPPMIGRGAFGIGMRGATFVGLVAGLTIFYRRSISAFEAAKYKTDRPVRFYGAEENKREVDMDMREMVDKVKRGESLYGEEKSILSPHMQYASHRNSRWSGTLLYMMPMANFVHHPFHGVDTSKYYRQAELELEKERLAK